MAKAKNKKDSGKKAGRGNSKQSGQKNVETSEALKDNQDVGEIRTEEEMTRKSLTQLEQSQLRLHEARVQVQLNIAGKLKLEEKLLGIEYRDSLSVLRGKSSGCSSSIIEAQTDYNDTMKAVEERLQVKLSNFMIQDDGSLVEHVDPGNDKEEPPN